MVVNLLVSEPFTLDGCKPASFWALYGGLVVVGGVPLYLQTSDLDKNYKSSRVTSSNSSQTEAQKYQPVFSFSPLLDCFLLYLSVHS